MLGRIETRARKLERRHERPLRCWTEAEVQTRLDEVTATMIEAHGSEAAVAALLRRRSDRAAELFLQRQQRKANAPGH